MKAPRLALSLGIVLALVLIGGIPQWAASQTAGSQPDDRFVFDVLESFDALYHGDTPGHVGRHGGLGEIRPRVALGDPVLRGDQHVGVVTDLKWSRAHGSLEVEFDSLPDIRVSVGDVVWVKFGGPNEK